MTYLLRNKSPFGNSYDMFYSKSGNLSMSDNTTTWFNNYNDVNNGLMEPLFFMSNNINRSTTDLAGAITRRRPNPTNYRNGSILSKVYGSSH